MTITDRDRWGLRGPVRSCRLQRTWYARRCGAYACETDERDDESMVEFREDGALDRQSHRNWDGSAWTSAREYDEVGRLVRMWVAGATEPVDLQRYEYDAAGRLARIVARAQDGHERVSESYEYDAAGGKKKTLHVDVAAQRPNTNYFWGADGTDSGYSAPGTAAVTTLHNTSDQPIELVFHDAAGQVLNRVEFVYDDAGHLVEEVQTRVADMLPPEMVAQMNPAALTAIRALISDPGRRSHRYDARGRRIETRSALFGPLGHDRKTMAYNDRGDQIAEISEDERRECAIDDEGRMSEKPAGQGVSRSEARFRYDYDVRGNWIEKVVESRSGADGEFSVSSIERRTLAYYDAT
jgi:YD repeat-containing protein